MKGRLLPAIQDKPTSISFLSDTFAVGIYKDSFVGLLRVKSSPLLYHYQPNSDTEGNNREHKGDDEPHQSINQHESKDADTCRYGSPCDITPLKSHELQWSLQACEHLASLHSLITLCHSENLRLVSDTEEQRQCVRCRNQENTSTDGEHYLLLEILLIARNVLIIKTNRNGKMTKETN